MPYADELREFSAPQHDPGGDIVARLAQALREERGSEPPNPLEHVMASRRQYFPELAAISGMQQAPPRRTMGAFMDDPFERAAYRQAGRQVGPPERGTDADIAQAAMVMAPAPLRAVMSAPKIATAGLAAYNFLSGTDSAGGAPAASNAPPGDAQSIMKLQEELRPYGYTGPIDGIWKGGTQRAYEAKQQADQLQAQKDAGQVERDKAASLKLDAEARAKETERLRIEGENLAERKRLGDERLRDIDKNISTTSRVIRDYSGPIGLGVGAVMGSGVRAAMKKGADYFSQRAADAGEKIMAKEPVGKAAALNMSRVARANDFWRKGGGEVPFTTTPSVSPGFAVNPNATSLDKLYRPSKGNYAADLIGFGLPVGESLYADSGVREAKAEGAKAREDYGTDPSESNIQRIQKATDNEALYQGASNAGRVAAGAIAAGRFTVPNAKIQPGMALAEQEQLSLQKILRDASERAQKKAAKSAPVEVPRTGPQVGVPPAMSGPTAHKARTLHSL